MSPPWIFFEKYFNIFRAVAVNSNTLMVNGNG